MNDRLQALQNVISDAISDLEWAKKELITMIGSAPVATPSVHEPLLPRRQQLEAAIAECLDVDQMLVLKQAIIDAQRAGHIGKAEMGQLKELWLTHKHTLDKALVKGVLC